MGLPASTAGLKREVCITMDLDVRTISPVPDVSRFRYPGLSAARAHFASGRAGPPESLALPSAKWEVRTYAKYFIT